MATVSSSLPRGEQGAMVVLAGLSWLQSWEDLDPEEYPFTRAAAGQLREHDDREQFLAGIDLILAGIAAVHPRAT